MCGFLWTCVAWDLFFLILWLDIFHWFLRIFVMISLNITPAPTSPSYILLGLKLQLYRTYLSPVSFSNLLFLPFLSFPLLFFFFLPFFPRFWNIFHSISFSTLLSKFSLKYRSNYQIPI